MQCKILAFRLNKIKENKGSTTLEIFHNFKQVYSLPPQSINIFDTNLIALLVNYHTYHTLLLLDPEDKQIDKQTNL